MSRLVNTLAAEAGMDPDHYLDSLYPDRASEPGEPIGGHPLQAEPPKPASEHTSLHDRRRYDAQRRRMQVR